MEKLNHPPTNLLLLFPSCSIIIIGTCMMHILRFGEPRTPKLTLLHTVEELKRMSTECRWSAWHVLELTNEFFYLKSLLSNLSLTFCIIICLDHMVEDPILHGATEGREHSPQSKAALGGFRHLIWFKQSSHKTIRH